MDFQPIVYCFRTPGKLEPMVIDIPWTTMAMCSDCPVAGHPVELEKTPFNNGFREIQPMRRAVDCLAAGHRAGDGVENTDKTMHRWYY